MPALPPTPEHLQVVGSVLGERGLRLYSRVEIVGSDEDCAPYCLFAGHLRPNYAQVVFPRGQESNPYLYVHEMAHAYHSIYFPDLTMVLYGSGRFDRAEACAALAEDELTRLRPNDRWGEWRAEIWSALAAEHEEFATVERMIYRARVYQNLRGGTMHDLFERIMFGVFDDNPSPGQA